MPNIHFITITPCYILNYITINRIAIQPFFLQISKIDKAIMPNSKPWHSIFINYIHTSLLFNQSNSIQSTYIKYDSNYNDLMLATSNKHNQINSNNPLQSAHKLLIFIYTKYETAAQSHTAMKNCSSALSKHYPICKIGHQKTVYIIH